VYPNTTYHTVTALILSKLYSNSLLSVLNARFRIVGGRDEDGFSDSRLTISLPPAFRHERSTSTSSALGSPRASPSPSIRLAHTPKAHKVHLSEGDLDVMNSKAKTGDAL